MSYDDNLAELTFSNAGRKYCLTRVGNFRDATRATGAMQQIRPSPIHGLIYFRQLIQSISVVELKKLLDRGDHHLNLHNEEPIRMRIATLIMDGSLSLFETLGHVSASHTNVTPSVKKPQIVYDDVDPRQMQSPADLIIYQERSPTPVATQKNETLNEQAQIAVLIAAAEQGTPLCELCKSE